MLHCVSCLHVTLICLQVKRMVVDSPRTYHEVCHEVFTAKGYVARLELDHIYLFA